MMLGPACNHDLNCFLRIPSASADTSTDASAQNAMLDAMGDHEFYCAAYCSKDEPVIEGLVHTLMDGYRRKQQDLYWNGSAAGSFGSPLPRPQSPVPLPLRPPDPRLCRCVLCPRSPHVPLSLVFWWR